MCLPIRSPMDGGNLASSKYGRATVATNRAKRANDDRDAACRPPTVRGNDQATPRMLLVLVSRVSYKCNIIAWSQAAIAQGYGHHGDVVAKPKNGDVGDALIPDREHFGSIRLRGGHGPHDRWAWRRVVEQMSHRKNKRLASVGGEDNAGGHGTLRTVRPAFHRR